MFSNNYNLKFFAAFIFSFLFLFSCSSGSEKIHVTVQTGLGDIEIALYDSAAPLTVAAFLSNVDSGFYDKSSFYRVVKADELPNDNNTGIIQGGVYPKLLTYKSGIPHETTHKSGLSHTNGIVSMARTNPGSATTEFFICIGDQSPLDSGRRGTIDGLGMAAFGKVVKGMDVVRKIQARASRGDKFDEKVFIKQIIRN